MRRGLYRFNEPDGDACCCVDWTAGDGAPFLSRSLYEMLGFEPRYELLPELSEFVRTRQRAPLPLFLRQSEPTPRPRISA